MTILRNTAVLLLTAGSIVQSADWPNWMGPKLDGISTESGWSVRWPESGLPKVWTAEIGIGFSSFSIVDDHLYTMGHNGGEETVWCLNALSGEVIWQHTYPAVKNANLYEGGPGSTPTVDGDFVYTLSVDGRLMCFRRTDGNEVWSKDLQTELDVDLHEWGFNSSPLILKNQLIVQGGRIVSFEKTNGEKLWQTDRHRAGYGSIRAFQQNGKTLLAGLDCDGLRIVTADNGTEIAFKEWRSPFRTNSTTPIIVDDRIFISTGYNVGCGLFRLTDDGLQKIYSGRQMRNHFNNSILFDGHLYGMDGNSNLGRVVTLTCIELETGDVKWKERGLGCGSLMIVDGKLLILSDKGELVVAQASPDGFEELARSPFLSGRCWTVPVLLNGHVFGRNASGQLVCARLPQK